MSANKYDNKFMVLNEEEETKRKEKKEFIIKKGKS